ncbi:glycosyltransferase family 87 protein [Neoroseomonas soli]|uniref:DUF2029 domain-containing protein n=1 Tax=Neoroseomonas soli TaxID=1081025 RepID=A0A9X9X203_9PROT|nr:glycosyltransferase family 87 protein [Neoroseomonas soli]MBR0673432.1 DUF2029 domain-containing protein [Neoroseomonas soli]
MTPARARLWCGGLAVAVLAGVLILVGTTRDGIAINGLPVSGDFLSFWAASDLLLAGRPADAYRPALHVAAQARIFPDIGVYFAFFYPPVFLLLCAPLALLPYGASVAAWLAVTGAAYVATMRALLPRWGLLPVLAFPAGLINIRYGQNGFLSAAIFAAAAALLDRRPVLAGVMLGGLVYKPHLAIAVPFVLAAARRWPAFIACGTTAAGLAALSWLVLGGETWTAFREGSDLARRALEEGWVSPEKMISLFAGIRLAGGPLSLAWAMQAVLSVAVLVAAVLAARRRPGGMAEVAIMAAAAMLTTPFLLDYDLVVTAVPLGWLLLAGSRAGFLPWEKTLLLALFLWPLVARMAVEATRLPLAAAAGLVLLALVLRRARAGEAQ